VGLCRIGDQGRGVSEIATPGDITQLLREAEVGREGALDELMHRVYPDLERIALSHLSRQFGERARAVTLEPAALVNESFLRLIRQRTSYDNRGHFFAIATRLMLRVLLDYQRHRLAARRGGGRKRIQLSLDGQIGPGNGPDTGIEIESLVKALERLEALDSRQAEVVKMRVIWGLEINEIADALGMSPSTVKRDWRFARAWLRDEAAQMNRENTHPVPGD
jgi:RNA polymerase sigma factor (TIGR02999 family)